MVTRRRLLATGAVGVAALSGCTEFITGDGPLSERAELAVVDESTLDETGYQLIEQDTETITQEVEVAGETRHIEAINQLSIYERAIDFADEEFADGELSDEDLDEFDEFDEFDEEDIDEFDEELPDDVDEQDIPDRFTNSLSTAALKPMGALDGVSPQMDTDTESSGSVFILFSTPAFSFVGQSFNPVGEMDNAELAELLSSEVDELTIDEEVGETTRSVLGSETTVTTFDATASETGNTVDMVVELTTVESTDDFVIGLAAYPQLLASTEAGNVEQLFDGIEHPVK